MEWTLIFSNEQAGIFINKTTQEVSIETPDGEQGGGCKFADIQPDKGRILAQFKFMGMNQVEAEKAFTALEVSVK